MTSSEITCNFRSLIYRCFSKTKPTYAIYQNHLWRNKNLLKDVRTQIETGADSEKIFLKSDFLRSDLRFLVSNQQVFFKMALGVRGFKDKKSPKACLIFYKIKQWNLCSFLTYRNMTPFDLQRHYKICTFLEFFETCYLISIVQ